jgi:hypothetical protein
VTYDADLYASLTGFTGFGKPNPLPPASPFNPPTGVTYTFSFTDYLAGDDQHLGTNGTIDFVHGGANPGHLTIHNVFSDPAYLSAFVGNGTDRFQRAFLGRDGRSSPPSRFGASDQRDRNDHVQLRADSRAPHAVPVRHGRVRLAALKLGGGPRRLASLF